MKLNYKILGEGKPLVILHGLFGMLDNWMSIAKTLAEYYQIILVDHRNHGKSPHSDNLSFDLYVEDLKELLDSINIDGAYIMGHSMGGKTAMTFAIKYPKRTLGMISIDMGAHSYWKGNHDQIFIAILPLKLETYSKRSEVDKALAKGISEMNIRQFLLKNLSRTESGFEWKANFQALNRNYNALREEVQSAEPYYGKSLFVRGGDSSYIRNQDLAFIKKLFPLATLETIEGAGHWIHAEKPKKLISLIKGFLE